MRRSSVRQAVEPGSGRPSRRAHSRISLALRELIEVSLAPFRQFTNERITCVARHWSNRNPPQVSLLHEPIVLISLAWRGRSAAARNRNVLKDSFIIHRTSILMKSQRLEGQFHHSSYFHFALDICNMPSPLFTGLPTMMQNFPFVKHGGAVAAKRWRVAAA